VLNANTTSIKNIVNSLSSNGLLHSVKSLALCHMLHSFVCLDDGDVVATTEIGMNIKG